MAKSKVGEISRAVGLYSSVVAFWMCIGWGGGGGG